MTETFVNEYIEHDRSIEYVKKHIINKYIDYEKKVDICRQIVKTTQIFKEGQKSYYRQNSPTGQLLYKLNIINLYTDLDIDFPMCLPEYNLLEKEGLINIIFNLIPAAEIQRFNEIYKMVIDDYYENNRSLVSYLDIKIKELTLLLNSKTNDLQTSITNLVSQITNITTDELQEMSENKEKE